LASITAAYIFLETREFSAAMPRGFLARRGFGVNSQYPVRNTSEPLG
jgi:hypothetical protein